MSKLGDVIDGKYEILKEVGRGGMSIVYLAMDTHLNKQWAVKEVKRKGSNSANQIVVQSLLAEANLMKKLEHPHLPRIVDIIENGDIIYIVMDYIEGEPLNKLLKAKGAQPQEAVIEWGKQLAEVLDYLHTRKPPIIYRDMKPANVMLQPSGNVKLIDFGIAREYKEQNSADTVSLGTKGYAAPEQFGGMGQTDARTDVYCLGVTLYHLVTGKNPTEPPYEILPIRSVNPKLSSGLEAIIQMCTQPNPDDRFQSCAEVLYALNHLEEFDGAYRKRQRRKLNAFIIAIAGTVLFSLAGVGCFIGYKSTLSQTVQSSIEQYGSKSPSGGNRQKLNEVLKDIGTEINESSLNSLITEYLDVCENDIGNIVDTYSLNNDPEISDEQKTEINKSEEAIFKDIENIERYYIQRLSEENIGKAYYDIGELYMAYYELSGGKYDTSCIKKRCEEAGLRFSKIKAGVNGEDKQYAKNISNIAECIKAFSAGSNKMSGDTEISEATKIEKWNIMKKCVNFDKELNTRQINMHLTISSILEMNKIEFQKLSKSEDGKKVVDEMYEYMATSTNLLKGYIENPIEDNASLIQKAKHAIEYYKDACQTITGNSIGGAN